MEKKRRSSIKNLLLTLTVAFVIVILIQSTVNDFSRGFANGWNSADPGSVTIDATIIKVIIWVVFFVIAALVIYFRMIKPVQKISKSMEKVKQGNLEEQIQSLDGMEFGYIEESFNSMVTSLKRARELENDSNEKNRRLYAEIAHDLKTPMTMILGCARLIKEGDLDPSAKERYLDTIIEQTANANALLEDMLEYAKLGSTEYKLLKEEGDIAELLRRVTADSFPQSEKKKITVDVDIPQDYILYSFDSAQMRRVFMNLIGNAIKHNPEGINVVVSLEDMRQEGKGIEILVSDNGALLSDDLKDAVFEPFRTGDDSRKSGNGSGLGLSVSRKIVMLHGGTLDYSETKVPGYKSFVLVLQS